MEQNYVPVTLCTHVQVSTSEPSDGQCVML